MKIEIFSCDKCHSSCSTSILVEAESRHIFVRCCECGAYIARYPAPIGDWHFYRNSYAAYLEQIQHSNLLESARDVLGYLADEEQNFRSECEALEHHLQVEQLLDSADVKEGRVKKLEEAMKGEV